MSKTRIQFDLTDDAVKQLKALKEVANAPTSAALIRQALVLYAWYLSRTDEGYKVVLEKDDERVRIDLLF